VSERRSSPAGRGIAKTFNVKINSDKRKWSKQRRCSPVGCASAYYDNFTVISKGDELVKSNADGARRKCPWGAK